MASTRWLPLESNPDVMNKYVHTLGASKAYEFCDVFGLDNELLMMVPQPVLSVVVLYPLTEKSEDPKTQIGNVEKDASDVYYIKQTIGNACGTIGLIHALCNNADKLSFDKNKHLSQFLAKTGDMSPEERGKYLESDSAFGEAHEESAQEGQTSAPDRDDKVDLHFIAFVHKNGKLYELDGRKDGPVCHGETTEDSLLQDSAVVIKKFIARDPENLNFTLVALAKQQ